MSKVFFVKTFGCQMNFNDSLKISNILIKKNFIKSNYFKSSDIIIINTCSIRENCHDKLYKYISKVYNLNKKLLFIIVGCVSNFLAKFLIEKFNFIKIILGTQNFHFIYKIIKMYYYYNCKQIVINFLNSKLYNLCEYNLTTNYITISEGCNKYCSYCIVPYARGNEISFYLNIILYKILILNKLYKNIILLGQNVNSYNSKIYDSSKKNINFNNLINYISQIFNIKNIFFLSSHPQDFSVFLIKNYKLNNKISNLLHLPIQSLSNKILNLMRRNYNLKQIKYIINNLKLFRKNLFISTDLIVGFCEENNCDFYKTIVFLEKFLFDKSYVFIYSPRPYTKSYFYNYNISNIVKHKRLNLINYKLKNNFIYINKMMIGKIEYILIKNYFFYKNNFFIGLTNNNRVLYFFIKNSNNFYILRKYLKIKIINIMYNIFYCEILNK